MKGMILAAGFGTRLAPLTDTIPKALVDVGGRPMIVHAINALLRAGCTELVVNAHHHAEAVADHFRTHTCGVPVHVVHESDILGTGGGILHARAWLDGDEPFFVHNADIVTTADLAALHRTCTRSGALAALLVQPRATHRALCFDAGMHLLGKEVWRADGASYPDDALRMAFCGIHVISPRLFECAAFDGFADIFDVYRPLLAMGERIIGHVYDGPFHDLGSVEKIARYVAGINDSQL